MVLQSNLLWNDLLQKCDPSRRGVLRAVLGSAFFSTLGVGSYTFALSLGAGSVGLSAYWLGIAFSAYFLARLVLAPLAGYCADYTGPLPLLLIASFTGAVSCLIYLYYPSVQSLGIIQIVLGFCSGIIKPVSMSLLSDYVSKDLRGRLFGAYNTCLYSSFVLGPLIGGALMKAGSNSWIFIVLIPAAGMGISFLLFVFSGVEYRAVKEKGDAVKKGLPLSDPVFWALLLAVFGRTLGASVAVTFLPRLLGDRFELSGVLSAIIFALPNVAIILGMSVTSRWSDIRDRTGLTFLGMGICVACLFGYSQDIPVYMLAVLSFVMGAGSAVSLPASMSLASEMGTSKGSVMGLFLGISNLGFVLGPGLAGFAAERGTIADSFEFTALISAVCLLPMFILLSRRLYRG